MKRSTDMTDRCHDCGVEAGQYHREECDVERCPYCCGQLVTCDCRRKPPLDDRIPWTGDWPGVAECREFGWYSRLVPGLGWVPCGPDEPGASEDLNRLRKEMVWDLTAKRYVLRQGE
jgi:hypothetical protein